VLDDAETKAKIHAKIAKRNLSELKDWAHWFCLHATGTKEELVNRILEFLGDPSSNPVAAGASPKKRKASLSEGVRLHIAAHLTTISTAPTHSRTLSQGKAKRQKTKSTEEGDDAESDDESDEEAEAEKPATAAAAAENGADEKKPAAAAAAAAVEAAPAAASAAAEPAPAEAPAAGAEAADEAVAASGWPRILPPLPLPPLLPRRQPRTSKRPCASVVSVFVFVSVVVHM